MIRFTLIYGLFSLLPALLLAQPTINLSFNTVPENAPKDTTIGLLSMTNPTAGATYTYTLSGADARHFTISRDTLKAAAIFDFETKSTYNLTLKATETGGAVYSKYVIIGVTNVNEAPSGVSLSKNYFTANSDSGTFIAKLTTTDVDVGDRHTYSIKRDPTAYLFRVSNDSLFTNVPYQTFAKGEWSFLFKKYYLVGIETEDADGLRYVSDWLRIYYFGHPPTDISLSKTTIAENQDSGAVVALLTSADTGTNDSHTYTLEGADSAAFVISKDTLKAAARFDFETKNIYNFKIRTTDKAGSYYTKAVQIRVTNENEAPSKISLSKNYFAANSDSGTFIAKLSTTDVDAGDKHTYSISLERDLLANHFTVSNDSLFTNVPYSKFDELAFGYPKHFLVKLQTQDAGGLTHVSPFLPIYYFGQPPTDISLSKTTITENQDSGTFVALLTTTDASINDAHTYTLEGADGAAFVISKDTLKTAARFDFETKNTHNFKIRTTDKTGAYYTEEVQIRVTNVNDPPYRISPSTLRLSENNPLDTLIAKLVTSDADVGDSHRYTLEGVDRAAFKISNDSLKAAVRFNFETKSSYEIILKTTDAAGISHSQAYTVTITDVNEAPTATTLSSHTIPENSPINTVVGTLTTTDPDSHGWISYTIKGADKDAFYTSPLKLRSEELHISKVPDAEVKSEYNIVVEARDNGGLTHSQNFKITVVDRNEPPTDLNLSNKVIAENKHIGTFIALLTTTDDDRGDTHTYTLEGDDSAAFAIVKDSLKTAARFDFETKNTYNFKIRTTDRTGAYYTEDVQIKVSNVNEAPSGISLSKNYFAANSDSGTFIAKLSTTDVDAGDRHTYTVMPDVLPLFTVSNDSLFTNVPYRHILDLYAALLKNRAAVRIRTQDAGGLSYTSSVIYIYFDGQPPTDITLSSTTIPENTPPNTKFSKITVTDPDDASHRFGATTTEGLAIPIVQVEGDSLQTSSLFDFEKVNSYKTTITVVDGHNTFSKTFTFTITDVPEAPTDITLSNTTVAEGQPSGTVVAVLTTTDDDRGDSHTYTLEGDDKAAFVISNDTLKTAARFDFETKNDYSFRIKTTDKTNLHYTKFIRIKVTNANEPPFRIIPPTLGLPENNPVDTLIAKLVTSDSDVGDRHSYTIEGVDRAAFKISNDSLKARIKFDFETKSSYNIILKATDAAGSNYSQAYTVTITNVNEAPTAITLSSQTIPENSPIHTTVGTLTTNDPDSPERISYTIKGADKTAFYISGSKLNISKVLATRIKSEYDIVIEARDNGGLTHSQNFKITVVGQNQPPTDLNLSAKVIAENSPIGTLVGKLTTTDPDASDTHTYTLGGSNAKYFKIVKDSLKLASSLNFERGIIYPVTFKTTDSGGKTFSKNIIITVTDVNDAPSDIVLGLRSATYETMPISTAIGKLVTVDEDRGDTHIYTLGGADASAFKIFKDTIKNRIIFDFETKAIYRFTVTTRDAGGKSYSEDFTLNISDIPERPTDITLSQRFISEKQPPGTLVGLLNTVDGDKNEKHTYAAEGGDAVFFKIVGDSLKTAAVFDFKTKASYNLSLRTTDKDRMFYYKNFTITVTSLTAPPTNIILSQDTVLENKPIGTLIGKLSTTDADTSDTHTYTLEGENAKYFRIANDSLKTATVFNFEDQAEYQILIKTTDSKNLTLTKSFTIRVKDTTGFVTSLPASFSAPTLDLAIYPNPSRGFIQIKGIPFNTDLRIELINSAGAVVKTYSQAQASYDLSSLPRGLYIALIEIDGKVETLPFMLN